MGPGTSAWQSFAIGSYGAHRYWVVADLQDDSYHQINELRMFAVEPSPPPQTNSSMCRVFDTFSSSGVLGVPPFAPAAALWQLSGSPSITSNGSQAVSGAGSDAIALIESMVSDGTVSVDWTAGSHAGVIARATDFTNYLTAYFANHSVYLARVQGGGYTTLGTHYLGALNPGSVNHLEIGLSGAAIEVRWNGAVAIQATDAFNLLATKHGLKFLNQHDVASTFDNFQVEGPTPPHVTSVVVTPSLASIPYLGETTLTAQGRDAAGATLFGVGFNWASSNPAALRVAATSATTAVVTAVGMGSATITATPADGASGTASASVDIGSTMIADGFGGATGASLTSGAPQVAANSAAWQVLSGPGIIFSDGHVVPTGAGGESLAIINAGAADTTVSVSWTPRGPGPWVSGLAFRASNATNYWRAYWGTNGLFLQRVNNLVATTIASTFSIPTPAVDQAQRIEVRLNAHHIEVWWNGALKLSADDAFNVTATGHGLWWATQYDHLSTMDDFQVEGQLPPTVSRVELSPVSFPDFTVRFARARTLVAVAYDEANQVIPNVSFAWSSSNPTSIGVTPVTGDTVNLSGLAMGSALITATPISGAAGSAEVSVALGPVKVSDAFSDVDGVALTAHQPEVTQASGWELFGTPDISITGNRASAASGNDALGLIEGGTADGSVQANWHVGGSHAGVVFRATDASNYWLAYWGTNALYLSRYENGVLENLRQVFLPVPGVGAVQRISVKLAGSKIEVWLAGSRVIEYDSTWNQTATKHGIRFYNQYDAASTIDNFQVLEPPDIHHVDVTPSFAPFELYTTKLFTATAYDTDGDLIPEVSFQFTSSEADLVVIGETTEKSVLTTGMGRGQSYVRAKAFGSEVVGTAEAWVTTTNPTCVSALPDPGFSWAGPGGIGQFTVIAEARCQWTVTSSDPSWLVPITTSGVGSGGGYYRVKPNGSPWEREAHLSISGHGNIGVSQGPAVATPGCFNGFFPGSITWAPQGGQRNIQVSAPSECVWIATSNVSWLRVWTSTGMGSGDLLYFVDPNEGPERTGIISSDGSTYVVTQEAGPSGVGGGGGDGSGGVTTCEFTFTAQNGSGGVLLNVETGADCSWSGTSFTGGAVLSPASGVGPNVISIGLPAEATAESMPEIELEIAGYAITLRNEPVSGTLGVCGPEARFWGCILFRVVVIAFAPSVVGGGSQQAGGPPIFEGPGPVERGGSGTFKLRPGTGRNATFKNWRFIASGDSTTVDRATATTSQEWTGILVTSGTVLVDISWSGWTGVRTLAKTVIVTPRPGWTSVPVEATRRAPNYQTPRFTLTVRMMWEQGYGVGPGLATEGAAQLDFPNPLPLSNLGRVTDQGPNKNLWYAAALEDTMTFDWTIHDDINNLASIFNQHQTGTFVGPNVACTVPTPSEGHNYGLIAKEEYRAGVIRHESGDQNSHWSKYRDALNDPTMNIKEWAEGWVTDAASQSAALNELNQGRNARMTKIWDAYAVQPCGAQCSPDCLWFRGFVNYSYPQ